MNKQFILIITYGPGLDKHLESLKQTSYPDMTFVFRLNGAHVNPESLAETVAILRNHFQDPKILVDLPCSKLRTSGITEAIEFFGERPFVLLKDNVNFPDALNNIDENTILTTHDSRYRLKVMEKRKDSLLLKPDIDGVLENGKGIHARGVALGIPLLSERDRKLIKGAVESNCWGINISYVRSCKDIDDVKEIVGDHPIRVIPKIETYEAMQNLQAILAKSPLAFVDRGDLAGEVGLENIPTAQNTIIEMARWVGSAVIFGTQFFTSMVQHPIPLIAELNDCHNCIRKGINGIQLSEETAIGKYPLHVIDTIANLVNSGNNSNVEL